MARLRRKRGSALWISSFPALITVILLGNAFAAAQRPIPVAGSENDGVRCFRHTCMWLPLASDTSFKDRDLIFNVDVSGKVDADFVLRHGKKELLRTPLKDLSGTTSVVWSDDGKNFAVTWSDGGESGGFHVRAFHLDGDSVAEQPAVEKAFAAFKSRHWCEIRGDNVQAYDWLPDSRSLVLVLSVYPTGDCGRDLGHTEGYVVSASTGEIVETWDRRTLIAYMRAHPEIADTFPR